MGITSVAGRVRSQVTQQVRATSAENRSASSSNDTSHASASSATAEPQDRFESGSAVNQALNAVGGARTAALSASGLQQIRGAGRGATATAGLGGSSVGASQSEGARPSIQTRSNPPGVLDLDRIRRQEYASEIPRSENPAQEIADAYDDLRYGLRDSIPSPRDTFAADRSLVQAYRRQHRDEAGNPALERANNLDASYYAMESRLLEQQNTFAQRAQNERHNESGEAVTGLDSRDIDGAVGELQDMDSQVQQLRDDFHTEASSLRELDNGDILAPEDLASATREQLLEVERDDPDFDLLSHRYGENLERIEWGEQLRQVRTEGAHYIRGGNSFSPVPVTRSGHDRDFDARLDNYEARHLVSDTVELIRADLGRDLTLDESRRVRASAQTWCETHPGVDDLETGGRMSEMLEVDADSLSESGISSW